MFEMQTDQKQLSRVKVEFEELEGSLTSGVRLMPLERVEVNEPQINTWPNIFYTNVNSEHFSEDGSFCLGVETVAKNCDEQVWLPFVCGDVDKCTLLESKEFNHTKKFRRFVQKFIIKISQKPQVPYVQFYCRAKKAKYLDSYFKEGDLMTIIIKHPDYPRNHPMPPLISVIPNSDATYVPMIPKQKLLIVTKESENEVDFKGHSNSAIHYSGTVDAAFNCECHYFNCSKISHYPETIFIRKKRSKLHKTVTVPYVEKDRGEKYPIILNPIRNSIIYAHNIDGFIVRFWKANHLPVVTSSNCPISPGYVQESTQYIERRFDIIKSRPYFYLQKRDHSWIIR
jgi:hypothetical protein